MINRYTSTINCLLKIIIIIIYNESRKPRFNIGYLKITLI